MKKKRGFKLKSGNNIVAKGRKPSNFKMMGASPAKALDVFKTFDVDGVETTERIGTGADARKEAIATEKANKRRRDFNRQQQQKRLDEIYDLRQKMYDGPEGQFNMEYKDAFDKLSAEEAAIERGEFEGGKPLTELTYTGKDARERQLAERGRRTTSQGEFDIRDEKGDKVKYPIYEKRPEGSVNAEMSSGDVTISGQAFSDEDKALQEQMIQKTRESRERGMPMKKKMRKKSKRGFQMKRKK